jgi:hypothetical protein
MPSVKLAFSVPLPNRVDQLLRRVRRSLARQPLPVNLLGDRDLEWSFVAARMPAGPARRLPRLLDGCTADHEEFWVKNRENQSMIADRQTALDFRPESRSSDPTQNSHALACFVLRKSGDCRTPEGA